MKAKGHKRCGNVAARFLSLPAVLYVFLFLLLLLFFQASALAVTGRTVAISPGNTHEDCGAVAPGQTLHYSFTSTAPVAFSIHYHKYPKEEMVIVMKRKQTRKLEGVYSPMATHEYCLMWANTQRTPVIVKYTKYVSGK